MKTTAEIRAWREANPGERLVLRGAGLGCADLRGADLMDADLRGAVLTDADLRGAVLTGADLRGAVLTGADLTDADLMDADLRGADLRGAVLTGADLTDAVLMDADLRGADLGGADLTGADLRGADLTGAVLRGAVLRGALGVLLAYEDGWIVYGVCFADGPRIAAGCRWFTVAAALEHWSDNHSGGIQHAKRARAAVRAICIQAAAHDWELCERGKELAA